MTAPPPSLEVTPRRHETIRDTRFWSLGDPRGVVALAVMACNSLPPSTIGGRWLPLGVDIHLPAATYTPPDDDYLTRIDRCQLTGGGCWADGSSLAGLDVATSAWDPGRGEFNDPMIFTALHPYYVDWIWPRIGHQPTPDLPNPWRL